MSVILRCVFIRKDKEKVQREYDKGWVEVYTNYKKKKRGR
jgi:hypothetical protein